MKGVLQRKLSAIMLFYPPLEQLLIPLSYFVLTPVLISYGESVYGVWAILITFSLFSQVVHFGMSALIPRKVSQELASGNELELEEYLGDILSVILYVSGGFLCLLALGWFLLDVEGRYYTLIVCFFSIVLFQEIDMIQGNVLKGMERFGCSFWFEFVSRSMWVLVVILGYKLTLNIMFSTVAAYAVRALIKAVLMCVILGLTHRVSFKGFKRKLSLIGESRWMWLQLVGGIVVATGDRFFVTSYFGTEILKDYLPLVQLSQLPFNLSASFAQPLLSKVARAKVTGTIISGRLLRAILSYSCICSIPSLFLIFSGSTVLSVWLGSDYAVNNTGNFHVLMLSSLGLSVLAPLHFSLIGFQEDRFVSLVNVSAGFSYLIAILAAVPFGLVAVCLAKITYPIFQLVYLLKFFHFFRDNK
ncbi:hypothetical protein [Parendozoicomonas sp. Alg238-R29]|uniref:lipopolysaccharide biosynthesis protein n=1 Tax=Parendozoicomonas sp. Alg238-R29 TaxID=2993446 RepID=UPI00248EA066|nr:hypothetical protein [Parendozoicomonas sp. Alg238-R29]